jgi:hypothetical protein
MKEILAVPQNCDWAKHVQLVQSVSHACVETSRLGEIHCHQES